MHATCDVRARCISASVYTSIVSRSVSCCAPCVRGTKRRTICRPESERALKVRTRKLYIIRLTRCFFLFYRGRYFFPLRPVSQKHYATRSCSLQYKPVGKSTAEYGSRRRYRAKIIRIAIVRDREIATRCVYFSPASMHRAIFV